MSSVYLDAKKKAAECIKGKSCGDYCIPKKNTCGTNSKEVRSTEQKQLKSGGKVLSYGLTAVGAGSVGSLLGATTVLGIAAISSNAIARRIISDYRGNFAGSAEQAKSKSRTINARRLNPNIKTGIFAVGGWGTRDAYSESVVLEKNIKKLGIDNLHIETESYKDFNISTVLGAEDIEAAKRLEVTDNFRVSTTQAYELGLRVILQKKRNPVAVDLAAKVMAFKEKNPNVDFQLVGHSGGGLIIQETHEILEKAGIKITSTAIGSPDIGLIPGTGDIATAASDKDFIVNSIGRGKAVNKTKFNNVQAHNQSEYFQDPNFKNFIKQRLTKNRNDSLLDREDSKQKCKKSKPCGDYCIPKKHECKATQNSNKQVKGKVESPDLAILGIGALQPAATVLLGAASVLGIGLVASKQISSKIISDYRANFASSAEIAKDKSKQIKAKKLKRFVKTGVFAVGGWGTKDAYSESVVLRKNIKSLGISGLHIETESYKDFNVSTLVDEEDVKAAKNFGVTDNVKTALTEAYQLSLKVVLEKKRNPVAVDLAAKVMAFKEKNPNVDFQLVGHSGGGLVIQETHEILEKAGIKVTSTALGSPDIGLIPGTGDMSTASSNKDFIVNNIGRGKAVNAAKFNNVQGHGQNEYFKDPDFKDFLQRRLTKNRLDSLIDRLDAKQKCKKGKSCGDYCIPKKYECKDKNIKQVSEPKFGDITIGNVGTIAANSAKLAMSMAGLTASTYLVQKARFQVGFDKSARLAKELADSYSPIKEPLAGLRTISSQTDQYIGKTKYSDEYKKQKAKQITFFVGGIGNQGLESDGMGKQVSKLLPDHHLVSVENPEQNIDPSPNDKITSPAYLYKVVKATLKQNLTLGRSDIAVRLAARAYAYKQENPDIPINFMGQSGGGMPVREAVEILKRMGVETSDIKVATTGSPYFGLTSPVGMSISFKKDPADVIYGFTMPNRVYVETPEGHSKYFSDKMYKVSDNGTPNKEVGDLLNKYFDRSKKRTDAKGKPCGDGYISAKFECKSKNSGSRIIRVKSRGKKNTLKNRLNSATAVNSALQSSALTTAGVITLSGAAVVGLPVATTAIATARYRAGVPDSAREAAALSEKIDPNSLLDFKDKEQITFVQSGFSAAGGKKRERVGNEKAVEVTQKLFPEHGVVGRLNKKFQLPQLVPDPSPELSEDHPDFLKMKVSPKVAVKFAAESLNQTIGKYIRDGKNPESIDLASEVYAYHRKYPDKPINLIGHSAGSMISREAGAILKELNVNVKVATIGGPDYGIIKHEPIKNFISTKDPVTGKLRNPTAVKVDDIRDHAAIAYLKHPLIKQQIKSFFEPENKDSLIILDAKGKPCGEGFISAKYECKSGVRGLSRLRAGTSPSKLKMLGASNDYKVNPATGKPYTIRELREVAKKKKIAGYGSMTVEEMQTVLQIYDAEPAKRDRIVQSVKKRKGYTRSAVEAAGLSGRASKGEKKVKGEVNEAVNNWKRLTALVKFASSAPVGWTAAAAGAFLFGSSVRAYERAKSTYREGLFESARSAEERAASIDLRVIEESNGKPVVDKNGKQRYSSRIKQDNITYAIGGGKGFGAQEIKDELLKGEEGNPGDDWFKKSNYIIPFDLKEGGNPPYNGNVKNEAGYASLGYVAHTAINGVGGILQNYKKKRNQDAVDLAANIYARAIQVSQKDGKTLVNKNKKINIVAHSGGGLVTKEALEILSKMDLKGSPSGKQVLERVNAVYLGTPHLGFTENVSRRQRTIVSANDPISQIPAFSDGARQQWISSVKGHDAPSYLQDPKVRDALRESFGFYQGSPSEVARKRGRLRKDSYLISFKYAQASISRNDAQPKCTPGNIPCGDICIPQGRTCRVKLNPTAVRSRNLRKVAARFGRGRVSRTIGGVGQDIERAYLRTQRLIQGAKDKIQKKQPTRIERIKERLAYEAKLGGVLLGQGTVSKRLRGIDNKIIQSEETANKAAQSIVQATGDVKERAVKLLEKLKQKRSSAASELSPNKASDDDKK